MPSTDDAMPPLRYALAARAEAEADTSGAWSLRHLRICGIALSIAGAALCIIGLATAGWSAALGVVVGSVIVGAFFTFSAVVIARVGFNHPKKVMWVALAAYSIKVIALMIVLVLMPRDGAVDVRWMAGSIGLGVAVWLGAHMRYVLTNKIFYVDPN
jgi:ATP synthase protein I